MRNKPEFFDQSFWSGLSWGILVANVLTTVNHIKFPDQDYHWFFPTLNACYFMYCAGRLISHDTKSESGAGSIMAAVATVVFSEGFHEAMMSPFIHGATVLGIGVSLIRFYRSKPKEAA